MFDNEPSKDLKISVDLASIEKMVSFMNFDLERILNYLDHHCNFQEALNLEFNAYQGLYDIH